MKRAEKLKAFAFSAFPLRNPVESGGEKARNSTFPATFGVRRSGHEIHGHDLDFGAARDGRGRHFRPVSDRRSARRGGGVAGCELPCLGGNESDAFVRPVPALHQRAGRNRGLHHRLADLGGAVAGVTGNLAASAQRERAEQREHGQRPEPACGLIFRLYEFRLTRRAKHL